MSDSKTHHNVYVIKLHPDVLKESRFLAENPGLNPSLPCYYVGITGLTPEERFQNHKNGYKASKIVKKYGLCLVPKMYKKYNPTSYEIVALLEELIALELRLKGHGVWQK